MSLVPDSLRKLVRHRAEERCEYCLLPQSSQVGTFPVDHVIPRTRNGQTVPENLALACPRCNAKKWTHVDAVDPETGSVVSLFNPRCQTWTDHFGWAMSDPTVLVPLTPIGRATVALLDLNAELRLGIRRWLLALGQRP